MQCFVRDLANGHRFEAEDFGIVGSFAEESEIACCSSVEDLVSVDCIVEELASADVVDVVPPLLPAAFAYATLDRGFGYDVVSRGSCK